MDKYYVNLGISVRGYEWEGDIEIVCPLCNTKIEVTYNECILDGTYGIKCDKCDKIIFFQPVAKIIDVEDPELCVCRNCIHHYFIPSKWDRDGVISKCTKTKDYNQFYEYHRCSYFERKEV